ncbi:cytoskeletal protein binding protein [Tulasnella sp. UAMH 9824]|nr:cytoskeletal protein binding protein [Tulasnella sp. UAMH 9824]
MAKEAVCNSAARGDNELTMGDGQQLFLLENLDDEYDVFLFQKFRRKGLTLADHRSWVKVQLHTPLDALSEAEPADGLVPFTSIEPGPPLYQAVEQYDYDPNWTEAMNAYLKEDERVLVSKPATGYVPANYVKTTEDNKVVHYSPFVCGYGASQVIANLYGEQSEDQKAEAAVAATPIPDPRAEGIVAIVLYDFEAYADDELTVKEGERLNVLDKENDDWWKCCNLNGNEGVVPAAYLDIESAD